MHDPIYSGWGNRTWLKGVLKNSFANSERARSAQKLQPSFHAVHNELSRLGLLDADGIEKLARLVATDILESFDRTNDNVQSLVLFEHLSSAIASFIKNEGLFHLPEGLNQEELRTTSQIWMHEATITKPHLILMHFDEVIGDIAQMFRWFISPIIEQFPNLLEGSDPHRDSQLTFTVSLASVMNDIPQAIERMVQLPFAPEFDEYGHTDRLRNQLEYNVITASGFMPSDPRALEKAKLPTKNTGLNTEQLIDAYLANTAMEGLFDLTVPITIPDETRFEHHFIVAGSGHGKTQTLQSLILHDLNNVSQGDASIVVLDSQGDLINNIRNLEVFAEGSPLANRLVVIDPTDVEYPVSLNLFDVNMERINSYSQLDRERMVNGILELYDFVLGSLLGAEMTQKQSVLFRYITRLLLYIPNATIHTFRELLEDGGSLKYQDSIDQLQGSAKAFFQSEFDSKEFVQTKRQVVRRLWGILENQSFERMFSHPVNKLDLYTEMNSGKVILINTAKDLLKETGTEIFGRFFIAMIAQAAQERSVIDKDKRMPTYVYVDEASDYFDHNIAIILSQARKFKVGMLTATQFLSQMDNKLQDAVFANTAIKFAGGVSAKDASILAREMRTDTTTIEQQEKLYFAAFIKGTTKQAVSLSIQPGLMERLPRMNTDSFKKQRNFMRERYATHYSEIRREQEEPEVDINNPAEVNQVNEATPWD